MFPHSTFFGLEEEDFLALLGSSCYLFFRYFSHLEFCVQVEGGERREKRATFYLSLKEESCVGDLKRQLQSQLEDFQYQHQYQDQHQLPSTKLVLGNGDPISSEFQQCLHNSHVQQQQQQQKQEYQQQQHQHQPSECPKVFFWCDYSTTTDFVTPFICPTCIPLHHNFQTRCKKHFEKLLKTHFFSPCFSFFEGTKGFGEGKRGTREGGAEGEKEKGSNEKKGEENDDFGLGEVDFLCQEDFFMISSSLPSLLPSPPLTKFVGDIIKEHCLLSPQSLAIISPPSSSPSPPSSPLTYSQLHNISTSLSQHLLTLSPPSPPSSLPLSVLILIPRSIQSIISMVAATFSHTPFLAYDPPPSLPPPSSPTLSLSRLRMMIERMGQCGGVLVSRRLTDVRFLSFVESDFPSIKIIDVDDFLVEGKSEEVEEGKSGVKSENRGQRECILSVPSSSASLSPSTTIFYYMFTSGSTSFPKLTAHSHSSSLSRLLTPHPHCALFPSDIVSHKTSLLFVDSVAEIFGTHLFPYLHSTFLLSLLFLKQ